MSSKDLSTGEMVTVTGPVIDPASEVHRATKECKETAVVYPHMESAHNGLLKIQSSALGRAAQKFIERGTFWDSLHDKLAKGIFNFSNGLYLIVDDTEVAARVELIIKKLLPEGLSVINMAYRTQAGKAVMRQSRLTEEDKDFLRSIPVMQGTLYDVFLRWTQAGIELGKVEDLKLEAKKTTFTPKEVLAARNRWIKVTRNYIYMSDLAENLPAPIEKWIERLHKIERSAESRKKIKPAPVLVEVETPETAETDSSDDQTLPVPGTD